MTESSRHKNSVKRLKELLQILGTEIYENNDERGDRGFMMPKICTDRGDRQYVLDIFAKLKDGTHIAVEVDYMKKASKRAAVKMRQRDDDLEGIGIKTLRYTPKALDGLTAAGIQADIDYFIYGRRAKMAYLQR